MPIQLKQPLRWKQADAAQQALLQDLQANILKGHGRRHTANLFLRFDDAAEARGWLHTLASQVTSARQQLDDNETFRRTGQAAGLVTLAFISHDGYQALGTAAARVPKDAAFRAGMAARGAHLHDPPATKWDRALRGELHALVLLADRTAAAVRRARQALLGGLPAGVVLVAEETGLGRDSRLSPGSGVEHFGYVDGRSQPLMLQEDIDKERDLQDGISVWDPSAGLDLALVRDPAGQGPHSHGSYLVFRKLEQDVRGFHQATTRLARALGMAEGESERAGALMIGRFRDGTPVVSQRAPGAHQPVPNNFDFRDDAAGSKCPWHSHIRKTNPRGESVGPGHTLAQERARRIARRGITYGLRRQAPDAARLNEANLPSRGVGLLFMAYQADIAAQFEFMQASWANAPGFLRPGTGTDPVIGQGLAGGQLCPLKWGSGADARKKAVGFRGFVRLKGGGYFFAPSISGLKSI